MPRIFDNIDQQLIGALRETLQAADRSDFCVGYFHLKGWRQVDDCIEAFAGGPGRQCRLLVGMQRMPQEELRAAFGLEDDGIDSQTAQRLRRKLAEDFRHQLTIGYPTDADERGLRKLAAQIRAGKVVVKLFLRHTLHAKLYLAFLPSPISPAVGFVGSSNLTYPGLKKQGELNVDVMDGDACQKLACWFEQRWADRWCVDISDDLVEVIESSWAREAPIPPYHIYLKIAYHLSQEAQVGLAEFRIPRDLRDLLFDFQSKAVAIAARHLNKRGGVLLGDVVGLGKTMMATALARVFEDDYALETLIVCPVNLVPMWEDYRDRFRLRARILPISRVQRELPMLRRYRLVIVDESHNLRNAAGKRFRALQEYIAQNESKVILLSATPYNKSYLDLSGQLRLFLQDTQDLGVRPEQLLKEIGEAEFAQRHQCGLRTLAAFEKSTNADDWRELMRLYLVRRTRSFIKANYAETDPATGRQFLRFADGREAPFPTRVPLSVRFEIRDDDPDDQYARLYAPAVVDALNDLKLPRYGLGNYATPRPKTPPAAHEARLLADLSRGGRRLMGFSRTNLFKRLESGGHTFIQSLERHALRNFVYLHAIERGLDLPVGSQDPALLDPAVDDADQFGDGLLDDADEGTAPASTGPGRAALAGVAGRAGDASGDAGVDGEDDAVPDEALEGGTPGAKLEARVATADDLRARAADAYQSYAMRYAKRFRWVRPSLFTKALAADLRRDADALLGVLRHCGQWRARHDPKLSALVALLTQRHPGEKVLVFTQFADTVDYLVRALREAGVAGVEGVTGGSKHATHLAWRFSPASNGKRHVIAPGDEIRVLVATDVLSEGQNLQDCAVVVNYDLPWAIIRLIQRAGRVDRIGQTSDQILAYTFLPADGVERIIRLRARVRQRLGRVCKAHSQRIAAASVSIAA